jgi:hypothetical protein
MRFSLLVASAALVAGLALSACSSNAGSSSALPSAGAQALAQAGRHGLTTHLIPGIKPLTIGCNYSIYAFCFYVIPGNAGPYVETSTGSGYTLYNAGWIVKNKNKKGKPDKKFNDYFYPDPGNPTYQYILYSGKAPKTAGPVKFTDYYCIGFTPSACPPGTYTFKLGIALEPAT